MHGEAQVYVEAPPDKVFQLVSDVTRVPEWSPECRRCEWLGEPSKPVAGARYQGHNRKGWMRWTVPCRVTDVEPGQVFAFETVPPFPYKGRGPQTRWRYEFKPASGGTVLTESFEVLWYSQLIIRAFFGGPAARLAQLEANVRDTLVRIKAAAEAS